MARLLHGSRKKVRPETQKERFLELSGGSSGLPLTRTMSGFISAETTISENEAGQSTFHLWEKWEHMSDFEKKFTWLTQIDRWNPT